MKLTVRAVCAVLALGMTAAEAQAKARWAIQPTPTPSGFVHGKLVGVSCSGASACTAVGAFSRGNDRLAPLVERWNGYDWTVEPVPLPTHAVGGALNGVSCTASTTCTAVGFFETKDNSFPLVERWSGRAWSVQFAPRRAALDGVSLEGLSCPSTGTCVAVGSNEYEEQPVALHTVGAGWRIKRTPDLGAYSGDLIGLSCTSGHFCEAVGNYVDSRGCHVPLVERWNGRRWSRRASPIVGGCGADETLYDVSCSTSRACIAGGYDDSQPANVGKPLLERWNGAVWKLQPSPNLAYLLDPWGGGGWVNGVSCTAPTSCIGAGAMSSEILMRPLIEHWNGSRWRVVSTPRVPLDGGLNSVSCLHTTACVAVGFDDTLGQDSDVPLIESTLRPRRTGGLG